MTYFNETKERKKKLILLQNYYLFSMKQKEFDMHYYSTPHPKVQIAFGDV